jgi:hypothetical protein
VSLNPAHGEVFSIQHFVTKLVSGVCGFLRVFQIPSPIKLKYYWNQNPNPTENTSPWAGFKLTMLVVMGTDCIGSCKSNYHTITTTMTPYGNWCNKRPNVIYIIMPAHGEVFSIQHFVIKLVSGVCGFLRVFQIPSPIKLKYYWNQNPNPSQFWLKWALIA